MNQQQIEIIEKQLGRRLTPYEKRMLRYTEKAGPEKKPSQPVRRKNRAQSA